MVKVWYIIMEMVILWVIQDTNDMVHVGGDYIVGGTGMVHVGEVVLCGWYRYGTYGGGYR